MADVNSPGGALEGKPLSRGDLYLLGDDRHDLERTVEHRWAVEEDAAEDSGYEWYVRWGEVTQDTPGARPITLLEMA